MRRAWIRFSLCISAALGVAAFTAAASPQVGANKRVNELTLAGLRPGRDQLAIAAKRYKVKYLLKDASNETRRQWLDSCTGRLLTLQADGHSVIQAITVSALAPHDGQCDARQLDPLGTKDWITGGGLRLGDPEGRVTELYGEPKNSGPTERDGTELEFLRYAFDWAGAGVPQGMEIFCARDTGRVMEITLTFAPL